MNQIYDAWLVITPSFLFHSLQQNLFLCFWFFLPLYDPILFILYNSFILLFLRFGHIDNLMLSQNRFYHLKQAIFHFYWNFISTSISTSLDFLIHLIISYLAGSAFISFYMVLLYTLSMSILSPYLKWCTTVSYTHSPFYCALVCTWKCLNLDSILILRIQEAKKSNFDMSLLMPCHSL